ncbi:MAG: FAD-binding protein, partial [Aquificaceae bacterium]|nr:FAD-binding protein [Aquificaceae bacterium]
KNRASQLEIKFLKLKAQEILADGRVLGILATDENNSLILINSKAVILASGGYSGLYIGCSNPEGARGDMIGSALRAGAGVKNLEFLQFHPTTLEGFGFLLTEALRGEGALIIDESGDRFVNELLPRDIVARKIYQKIKSGKRVFLDLRNIKNLPERFPTIFSKLTALGFDLEKPVPIVPGAHYSIGGIATDLWGRSELEGLYAVGECANNGVHGANRLASNALLEGLVFGARAGYAIYHDIKWGGSLGVKTFSRRRRGFMNPEFKKEELGQLLFEFCGLERDENSLKKALERVDSYLESASLWERTPENRELFDMCIVAKGIIKSALWRKESRGVHFRSDFPTEREEFRKDSYLSFSELALCL